MTRSVAPGARSHDPSVDAPYFEVHPVMLTAAQERFLEADWRRLGLVSDAFRMRGGPVRT